MIKHVNAGVLNVAFEELGSHEGWPVLLLHGFPYDIHAYEIVAQQLVAAGAWAIIPYLRGYGATRFLSARTMRSGQQAALGADLLALLDALNIRSAVLAGYDWGGRAACIVAALWPDRVEGLVSGESYNIQDIAKSGEPDLPENEYRLWYQYYFHSERGRVGLRENRRELCKLLWRLWSPSWTFDESTYNRTAVAFDSPDFVEVVTHSYRHRFGLAAGDPALEEIECRLAAQPPIVVPSVTLDGAVDGVMAMGGTANGAWHFTGSHQHRILRNIGHNLPQEAAEAFAEAVLTVKRWSED
jgi:pimeloyl-ACP methyl ester carboxylesterase